MREGNCFSNTQCGHPAELLPDFDAIFARLTIHLQALIFPVANGERSAI
jgi:hypothetical protein